MPIKYVTPPRARTTKIIGNERCGQIEIESFGGLTTEEVDTIQEIVWGTETPYVKAAALAAHIASREKIKNPKGELRPLTVVEAFQIISDSVNDKKEEEEARNIAIKYAKEIAAVASHSALYQLIQKKATVTAVLKHRNASDHTHEDTLKLDSELIDLIYAETYEEKEASKQDKTDGAPPSEEDLGKQQEGNSSQKK
jgi:hypothetical protein